MSIDTILAQAAAAAVKELYGADFPAEKIVPQTTKKEFEGNETIVVFPFLKASRKAPDVTAQEIGEHMLAHCDVVEKFNVIKGFLNITIKPPTGPACSSMSPRRPIMALLPPPTTASW